jgi:hypothetical protein
MAIHADLLFRAETVPGGSQCLPVSRTAQGAEQDASSNRDGRSNAECLHCAGPARRLHDLFDRASCLVEDALGGLACLLSKLSGGRTGVLRTQSGSRVVTGATVGKCLYCRHLIVEQGG